jgi:hypothetical protein
MAPEHGAQQLCSSTDVAPPGGMASFRGAGVLILVTAASVESVESWEPSSSYAMATGCRHVLRVAGMSCCESRSTSPVRGSAAGAGGTGGGSMIMAGGELVKP